MRRCFGLCLVLSGAALGWVVRGVGMPAAAQVGGAHGAGDAKCSSQNGDVNADGTVNLSDAVAILGHLFLGNPTQLVPLCAPPPAPSWQPTTGQWECYDQDGNVVDCTSATCPGQDGSYTTGCPSEGRFTDNGDGTVTDHCTGLMWQRDTADVNEDGKIDDINDSDRRPWCDALAYCEKLSFAGHDDWRLPNVREIQSIADYGRFIPSIDPVFGALSSVYWSSTSIAGLPHTALIVGFNYGNVGYVSKGSGGYVRAVRAGP